MNYPCLSCVNFCHFFENIVPEPDDYYLFTISLLQVTGKPCCGGEAIAMAITHWRRP